MKFNQFFEMMDSKSDEELNDRYLEFLADNRIVEYLVKNHSKKAAIEFEEYYRRFTYVAGKERANDLDNKILKEVFRRHSIEWEED